VWAEATIACILAPGPTSSFSNLFKLFVPLSLALSYQNSRSNVMSSKIPPQSEGHESKVEELIFYVRYAKILFYSTALFMAVNALLTYGLIFHQPRRPSPEMCSRYCPPEMYSLAVHENVVVPRLDNSHPPQDGHYILGRGS
jgi:hypothetical protein